MRRHTETLCDLADLYGWRTGAEIGVRRGNTTAALLRECPKLFMYAVDPWEPQTLAGQVYTAEKVESFENDARRALEPYGARCVILKARSTAAAPCVPDASLDFVFIDGDHTAEGVFQDVLAWAPKLRPSGAMLGHDVSWPSVRAGLLRAGVGYETLLGDVWRRTPAPANRS